MPISEELLRKYRSRSVFVETGTYYGDTVALALSVGFSTVYSVELSSELYARCRKRFVNDPVRVRLFLGPSEACLPRILSQLTEPCVFWLDGHYSQGETALGKKWCPLYEELDVISTHHIKTHTILIDDVRLVGNEWRDISMDGLLTRLRAINPRYEISFEADSLHPQDVLVAVVK